MSDEAIRVVLDASAVLAYAKGSIGVGEVIVELDEEAGLFAVPAVCLIGAAQIVADAHLRLLTRASGLPGLAAVGVGLAATGECCARPRAARPGRRAVRRSSGQRVCADR